MSATYYLTLTDYGSRAIANAHAAQPIVISHLVLGDADGKPYVPESRKAALSLVNERARIPVTQIRAVNNQAQVMAVIESHIGGFHFHEIGLTDSAGNLLYIGNWHGGYKPVLAEGAGGDMELTLDLVTAGVGQVIAQIDPNGVTASQSWAISQFATIATANQLTNAIQIATALLQHRILDERDAERDRLYPVGSGLHFRHDHRNPAEALGFGQWQLISQGRALVGLNPEQSDWTGQIGGEFGTSTHTLTVDELPTHTHGVAEYAGVGTEANHITATINGSSTSSQTGPTGGSQPHNNVPPSHVIAVWLRTA